MLQPDPPKPVQIVELPKPLPLPGQLKPLPGTVKASPEAADPHARVDQANGAARIQPTRAGYLNAIQVYPFSDGALYQVYAAPGEKSLTSRLSRASSSSAPGPSQRAITGRDQGKNGLFARGVAEFDAAT